MNNIFLIRHAQSFKNLDPKNYNGGLTPNGIKQCVVLHKNLYKNYLFQPNIHLVSSPFLRCIETARYVFPSLEINIESDLREEPSSCPQSEHWIDNICYRPETKQDFLNRISKFYNRYCLGEDTDLIVVTHGTVIDCILANMHSNITEIPEWNHLLPNCSLTIVSNNKLITKGLYFGVV